MLSKICQIEIHVNDIERAILFYRSVFGWSPVKIELHNCVIIDLPSSVPYGICIIQSNKRSTGNSPIVFFDCLDLRKTNDKILASGGRILETRAMPGYGHVLIFQDPFNNALGLFQKSETNLTPPPDHSG